MDFKFSPPWSSIRGTGTFHNMGFQNETFSKIFSQNFLQNIDLIT